MNLLAIAKLTVCGTASQGFSLLFIFLTCVHFCTGKMFSYVPYFLIMLLKYSDGVLDILFKNVVIWYMHYI